MRQREGDAERLRTLGAQVRSLRSRRGLTQEDLAEAAGVHRTYVGAVERGERNPSFLNLHVLADALEVSVAELVSGLSEECRR